VLSDRGAPWISRTLGTARISGPFRIALPGFGARIGRSPACQTRCTATVRSDRLVSTAAKWRPVRGARRLPSSAGARDANGMKSEASASRSLFSSRTAIHSERSSSRKLDPRRRGSEMWAQTTRNFVQISRQGPVMRCRLDASTREVRRRVALRNRPRRRRKPVAVKRVPRLGDPGTIAVMRECRDHAKAIARVMAIGRHFDDFNGCRLHGLLALLRS
jgi:hypothetical protein